MSLNKIFQTKKGKWIPIAGCFVGILLLLWGGMFSQDKKGKTGAADEFYNVGFYTEALEKRIEKLCTSIGGISDATVLLTLDCGTEYVYAQKIQQAGVGENISYSTDYIVLHRNDEDSAALVMEIYPKIRGIAVVCTDGENIQIKQKVIELLSAALGVSSNRIKVVGN